MGVSLLSNPPYNIKHKLPDLAMFMSRYMGWTLPPESNANYAFILSALDWIDERAAVLLPNGVATSSIKKERQIREELVKRNLLLAVIALPASMFESTSIPTCLLLFDKNKDTQKIAMIDLTDKCKEEVRDQRGQLGGNSHTGRTYHKIINVIPNELMLQCLELINDKKDEEGLCVWISPEQAEKNDYNLTPRRFFEHKTEIKHRTFEDIANDYNRIIRQKNAIKIRMNRTAAKRLGFDCMNADRADLSKSFGAVGQKAEKENNISFCADDGIRITTSTKEEVHPLIVEFLNHWKQMIIYLNNEENRLLAEFRDAIIPELMTGKIKVGEGNLDDFHDRRD